MNKKIKNLIVREIFPLTVSLVISFYPHFSEFQEQEERNTESVPTFSTLEEDRMESVLEVKEEIKPTSTPIPIQVEETVMPEKEEAVIDSNEIGYQPSLLLDFIRFETDKIRGTKEVNSTEIDDVMQNLNIPDGEVKNSLLALIEAVLSNENYQSVSKEKNFMAWAHSNAGEEIERINLLSTNDESNIYILVANSLYTFNYSVNKNTYYYSLARCDTKDYYSYQDGKMYVNRENEQSVMFEVAEEETVVSSMIACFQGKIDYNDFVKEISNMNQESEKVYTK